MWVFQGCRDTCNKVLHAVCSALSNPPNVWQQVHKDLPWSYPDSFIHIFFLCFTCPVAPWSPGLALGTHGRQESICLKCLSQWLPAGVPPSHVGMGGMCHTHLLPVAVCGQGPVGSPPQRRPVVVEVASGVHLVLQAQNSTPWLESSL